ncbi:MAG: hypothetical protein AB2669_17610 [Candidatus Thiodiazotropha endolucinida]|nr:hypothetical protein [Candidatus Thiodiazotropha taylori]MCW4250839.1 hypothetical protein [Candidatus Thiodiazotropha endolucinida]MCG8040102.1 hypothetical protein [Candidatus Thiodiazotropha taylori]MCG8104557.1 hypothetical protein [Candidatus Thiodiazotropha taylori]MCG8121833.1 hypothetical protein [Candidatus Thiodiazotropha taylori]
MKKKLVMEYWSSKGKVGTVSPQHALSRCNWLCEVMFEDSDGIVDEFEVIPDSKMLLADLLPYIKDQLDNLVPDDAVDCGFRIYRR